MTQLQWTKIFKKDFKNLPNETKKSLEKQLQILSQDSYYPSLRIKKTKGIVMKGYSDVFEGRINKNYRFFFIIEGDIFTLLRCGTHDELLK